MFFSWRVSQRVRGMAVFSVGLILGGLITAHAVEPRPKARRAAAHAANVVLRPSQVVRHQVAPVPSFVQPSAPGVTVPQLASIDPRIVAPVNPDIDPKIVVPVDPRIDPGIYGGEPATRTAPFAPPGASPAAPALPPIPPELP